MVREEALCMNGHEFNYDKIFGDACPCGARIIQIRKIGIDPSVLPPSTVTQYDDSESIRAAERAAERRMFEKEY